MVTRRARAYEARVRARRFRAGLDPAADVPPEDDTPEQDTPRGDTPGGDTPGDVGRVRDGSPDDAVRPVPVPAGAAPLFAGSTQVVDGEPFTVRTVTGAAAAKTYVCPRCLQAIPPRFPHLVVWPVHARLDGSEGLSVRRHWHRHCWASHVRTASSGRPR